MTMNIKEILENITKEKASDIFIVAGRPLTYKVNSKMVLYNDLSLTPEICKKLITDIYELADQRDITHYESTGDDDFSFAIKSISRFRVSTYKQRCSYSAVIRIITFSLPKPKELMIPDSIMDLVHTNQGMILITGPAGSGKSTTLSCLIDKINTEQEKHVITLEDPLEYLHPHKKSIVSQREIFTDTTSYLKALRSALRQCPDVILLGEMRDYETINTAMTAAETGHLIFSTLHTVGAANSIERIIDAFPSSQQNQVGIQLSMVLRAVVSQKLLPAVDGRIVPAFELMLVNPAIRTLIRESKPHQIDAIISTSSQDHMVAMDDSILHLYKNGIISDKTAIENAMKPEIMKTRIL